MLELWEHTGPSASTARAVPLFPGAKAVASVVRMATAVQRPFNGCSTFAEPLRRRDFTVSERVEIGKALEGELSKRVGVNQHK